MNYFQIKYIPDTLEERNVKRSKMRKGLEENVVEELHDSGLESFRGSLIPKAAIVHVRQTDVTT